MEEIEYNERTCIVVIRINNLDIGMIVDEVLEVLVIDENDQSPAPSTNKGNAGKYLSSIGHVGDTLHQILDLEKLLKIG